MNYDFNPSKEALRVPRSAYKPIKRCPFCQSVYINEKTCEACGRSMVYHPIGIPFGPKSFYGIKERYVENQDVIIRFFPQFEDRNSSEAKSYVRNLSKRFADLITGFNTPDLISNDERKVFYAEGMEIIDELLRYGFQAEMIQFILEENDNSLAGRELLVYLGQMRTLIKPEVSWQKSFLEHRLWGVVRVEYAAKVVIITATVLTMAVKFKDIISSQFGR